MQLYIVSPLAAPAKKRWRYTGNVFHRIISKCVRVTLWQTALFPKRHILGIISDQSAIRTAFGHLHVQDNTLKNFGHIHENNSNLLTKKSCTVEVYRQKFIRQTIITIGKTYVQISIGKIAIS